MNILAIDIGTYSIKFFEFKPERKSFSIIDKEEIILDDVKLHYPSVNNIKDLQKEIVANFIQKKPNELRIIFQIPNEFITTRYLEIPATSKRKAEQIIPFQLDENLPYSIGQAHFSSRMIKKASGFSVISNITQLNLFKEFISFFENKDAQPTTITSEISTIQSYIDHIRLNDSCCIIDLGHKTTKAYFIQDRKVVSNHTSYIAGNAINEVISKTYQISIENAITYKHESSYFLSDDQFENVEKDQKEFALLMTQLFLPLVSEIKRWNIGHRVKYGHSIDKIYLMGGTSQINGIEHFLEYHTGIRVHNLPPITDFKNDYSLHDKNLLLVKMMAISERTPSALINFLTGKFQTSSNSIIPMHSAVFIWVRSSFIALLILIGLLSERFIYLNNNDKVIDSKITQALKQNTKLSQDIPKSIQKDFKNNPQSLLKTLKTKNKIIKDEVSSILSSKSTNALKSLALLSRTISNNPKVNLVNFSSDGESVKAKFEASEKTELELMEKHLKGSGLFDLETHLDAERNILNISFTDRD